MPSKSERYWERPARRDGAVSSSAGSAIGIVFTLIMMLSLVALGFSLTGFFVGIGLGVVAIVLLSKLVASSNKPPR